MTPVHAGRLYAHIDFPPYVFQEYPKWVTKPDGKTVVANNQKEELAMMAEPAASLVLVSDNSEIVALRAELEAMRKQLSEAAMAAAQTVGNNADTVAKAATPAKAPTAQTGKQ